MTRTYWLSFVDADRPVGDRFVGAALVDVDEADRQLAAPVATALRARHGLPPLTGEALWVAAAVQKAHRAGCNPGGEVATLRVDESEGFRQVEAQCPRQTLLSFEQWEALGMV